MPLSVILIIAVLAMAALAALLNRLGYSERAKLTDVTQARILFEKEHPGSEVDQAILSSDGLTALLMLRGDAHSLGLIQSLGDEFLTRILSAGQIARVDKGPDNTLNITFDDFTYPRARVHFGSTSGARGITSGASMYHQRLMQLVAGAQASQPSQAPPSEGLS